MTCEHDDEQWAFAFFTKRHLREREFVNQKRQQDYEKVVMSVRSDLSTSITVGANTLELTGTQAKALAVQFLKFLDRP